MQQKATAKQCKQRNRVKLQDRLCNSTDSHIPSSSVATKPESTNVACKHCRKTTSEKSDKSVFVGVDDQYYIGMIAVDARVINVSFFSVSFYLLPIFR